MQSRYVCTPTPKSAHTWGLVLGLIGSIGKHWDPQSCQHLPIQPPPKGPMLPRWIEYTFVPTRVATLSHCLRTQRSLLGIRESVLLLHQVPARQLDETVDMSSLETFAKVWCCRHCLCVEPG